MKAWQFVGDGQPLTLNEVSEADPGPGEVGVDILAAGLCHSDVGYLEGAIPSAYLGELPRTLGHEVAGRVRRLGAGVEEVAVGDVVAMLMSFDGPGASRDGGYAPYGVYPVDQLVKVPTGVSAETAAAATDAGRTAVHNVKDVAQVSAGTRLGIVGLGGLGLIGLQVGIALGAEVYAAEPKDDARAQGLALGARECVTDAADLQRFNLDVIVDFAGFGTTTAAALRSVRDGGTVVLVGLSRNESTINTPDFALRGLTLKSDATSTRQHLIDTLELIASGAVSPVTTTIGFDQIAEGLERVARGDVLGRLVAVYPDPASDRSADPS